MLQKGSFEISSSKEVKDRRLWRDLTAYWFLGLCNNYGYVVMLSAAHDIIDRFDTNTEAANDNPVSTDRQCHILSTGAILVADIFPSLFVKFLMPFMPLWVNTRIFIAVLCSFAGFLLVGFATATWMAILGVVVTSASRGIGEATFLSYSSKFNRNVISTWSSGTGGAGVVGSLSYASIRSFNVSPRDTMLIMLVIPTIEAIAFWIVLRNPKRIPILESNESTEQLADNDKPLETFKDKMFYMRHLVKYMVPLAIVYFFEYFINQGLFELVNFENTVLDRNAHYRWFNVTYQIGVFISRSSVNLVRVPKVWILTLLQFVNVMYFLTETLYYYTPTIWITFCIILWEGLLGGAAYVNTFYRISQEVSPIHREFSMAMVVLTDALGVTLAGFLAMPIHNAICALPAPTRIVSW